MSAWVDIKFAPRDGTKVDLWVVSGNGIGCRIPDCLPANLGAGQIEGWVHRSISGEGDFLIERTGGKATHYMPIPAGPIVKADPEPGNYEGVSG